jgi:hypothetical protein
MEIDLHNSRDGRNPMGGLWYTKKIAQWILLIGLGVAGLAPLPPARADLPSPSSPGPMAEDPGGGGGWLWAQMIEKGPGSTNKKYPSYYYHGQYYCDNDPDIDYTMVYNMSYGQNPDSLRYYSEDPLIQWFGPSALKGYSYTWDKVHVCVGTLIDLSPLSSLMNAVYLHQ